MADYNYSDAGSIGGSFPPVTPPAWLQRGVQTLGGNGDSYAYPAASAMPSPADNLIEAARLSGAQTTALAGTGLGTTVMPRMTVPSTSPTTYDDADASFGFRNRLAANRTQPAAPGTALTMQYGPGVGGANVTATADKTGRFNQFSGTPGMNNTPSSTPSPLDAQMQMMLQRQAYYRSMGGVVGRAGATNIQKQINIMRTQQLQQGTLGVQQRDVGVREGAEHLAEQTGGLANERAAAFNAWLAQGSRGLPRIQAAQAALEGKPNVAQVQGIGENSFVPYTSIPESGLVVPTFPGQMQPVASPYAMPQLPRGVLDDSGN